MQLDCYNIIDYYKYVYIYVCIHISNVKMDGSDIERIHHQRLGSSSGASEIGKLSWTYDV